jgi:hypothetical protein
MIEIHHLASVAKLIERDNPRMKGDENERHFHEDSYFIKLADLGADGWVEKRIGSKSQTSAQPPAIGAG